MECKLIKGQHVLCIDVAYDPSMLALLTRTPEIGKIYTVDEVDIDVLNDRPIITVDEITPQIFYLPRLAAHIRMAWHALAFKPLEKLKVEDFTTEGVGVDA